MGREDEIRLIAYKIWEDEGCKNGHDCAHWFRAETVWEINQKKNIPQVKEKTNKAAKPTAQSSKTSPKKKNR
jgi:hypothetical protein